MQIEQIIRKKNAERIYRLVQVIPDSFSMSRLEELSLIDIEIGLRKKLKIVYMMNHVRVCGGAKIILEHTNHLVDRGHEVYIICKDSKPDWIEVKANYIQANRQMSLVQSLPDADIVICTTIDQVPDCYFFTNVPIVMFEQGDTYIYEFNKLPQTSQEYFKELWKIPVPVFGVSQSLLDILFENFGCKGHVLHNALDKRYFYPKADEHPDSQKPRILFVGQENNEFKGIQLIKDALLLVKERGYDFEEVWVTQTPPQSIFHGKLVVNPMQQELGEIYRSCDIFVSGSYYESFSLPVLEAMSCGCAVVSTKNAGVQEYAEDGYNCLLANIGDAESLASCIIKIITNQRLKNDLVNNAYKTAAAFDWSNIISKWEQYLYSTIQFWKENQREVNQIPIRIEKLPKGITNEQVNDYIASVQLNMEEEWCLYLVDGEEIGEEDINRVRSSLAHELQTEYALQVIYPNDIPGHPLLRLENRLIRKGQTFSTQIEQLLVLPIQIRGASELYFSPHWMKEVRGYYLQRNFTQLITFVKLHFQAFSQREQVIALRWVMLALIELDQNNEAVGIFYDAFQVDPTYSDLLYLCSRVHMMLDKKKEAKQLLELARFSGTSLFHGDCILNMEDITDAFLEKI